MFAFARAGDVEGVKRIWKESKQHLTGAELLKDLVVAGDGETLAHIAARLDCDTLLAFLVPRGK